MTVLDDLRRQERTLLAEVRSAERADRLDRARLARLRSDLAAVRRKIEAAS